MDGRTKPLIELLYATKNNGDDDDDDKAEIMADAIDVVSLPHRTELFGAASSPLDKLSFPAAA